MRTLGECLREGRRRLRARGIPDGDYDAQQLMTAVFGLDRQELLLREGRPADEALADAYFDRIAQRSQGRPLQYILGEWTFCGLSLSVGEGVLIPRQETELLVLAAKDFCRGLSAPRILDLCSGSGAIAVACGVQIEGAAVTACELSAEALGYLRENVRRHRAPVRVLKCDVLRTDALPPLEAQDVILANPPYIPRGELPFLQPEVRREPSMALDGGEDGLIFYRSILSGWLCLLRPGGLLAVECGDGQAHTIERMFARAGLSARVVRDLGGGERMVCGEKTR